MATKKEAPTIKVVSEPFVLNYPKLLVPEPYKDPNTGVVGDKEHFSFEALSTPESLKLWQIDNDGNFDRIDIVTRLVALAKEMWGGEFNCNESVKHGGMKWPFKSGDIKADDKGEKAAHYRDKKVWRAKTLAEYPPTLYESVKGSDGLIVLSRDKDRDLRRIKELFYSGAICTAELTIKPYEVDGRKHLPFYLANVIFEQNGERIAGHTSMMERMRGLHGGKTQTDPTAGMDTDLPDGGDSDEIPY